MKQFLFYTIMLVSLSNLHASDVAEKLLINKNMRPAIALVHKLMAEIAEKKVRHVETRVSGGPHLIINSHFYDSVGQFYDNDGSKRNVVDRYQSALQDMNETHINSSFVDGALLGFLMGVIAQGWNNDLKISGIGLAVCTALLTIAKHKQLGTVPYLGYPKLDAHDNCFGTPWWYIGTFMFTGAGATVGYFGSTCLMHAISNKIAAFG